MNLYWWPWIIKDFAWLFFLFFSYLLVKLYHETLWISSKACLNFLFEKKLKPLFIYLSIYFFYGLFNCVLQNQTLPLKWISKDCIHLFSSQQYQYLKIHNQGHFFLNLTNKPQAMLMKTSRRDFPRSLSYKKTKKTIVNHLYGISAVCFLSKDYSSLEFQLQIESTDI